MTAVLSIPAPETRPDQSGPAALSLIIVNYRQWANTARLVAQLHDPALLAAGRAEIIVVDNDSPAPPAALRLRLQRLPGVRLRRLPANRGFARGVNAGVRLSRGDWVLLLNPDVSVAPGFLAAVCALTAAESNARLGILGLQIRDPDGTIQGSVGRDPSFLGTLLGQLRPRAVRKCRPALGRQRRRVPWVTGCGLLVRRECFAQLGGFDPDYFLYYEDVDLCRRARAAGWHVCHDPALHATHHHPLHGRPLDPKMRLLTRHALLTFARKHWHAWPYLALVLAVCLEGALRARWADRPGPRRRCRALARIAFDLLLGDVRAAYRRVWRAAQRGS